MYNSQLETFLRVADAGSFSKAAEEMCITLIAVIEQINLLENSLGVKLFYRTHQWLILTKAGAFLYRDTKCVIRYYKDSVTQAKNDMQKNGNVIRIGSSPFTPARLLMQLWPRIQAQCADIKFEIVPFANTRENAWKILGNLGGGKMDVVGGFLDVPKLDLQGCSGFELFREPFCCAVSVRHPLAAKDKLKMEDLYGENLLLIRQGWDSSMDELRHDIRKNHKQIRIMDYKFYDTNIYNRCADSRDVLLILGQENVHPLLKVIPMEWEYGVPYNLLHSPKPSETVKRFLEAARTAAQEQ